MFPPPAVLTFALLLVLLHFNSLLSPLLLPHFLLPQALPLLQLVWQIGADGQSQTGLQNLPPEILLKTSLIQTCKRVQSLLGQDRRLQRQLADAELARERQMSQVTMPTTDLLQQQINQS